MATPAELQGAIVGMGNPLLDISAEVPVEFLEKCVEIGALHACNCPC